MAASRWGGWPIFHWLISALDWAAWAHRAPASDCSGDRRHPLRAGAVSTRSPAWRSILAVTAALLGASRSGTSTRHAAPGATFPGGLTLETLRWPCCSGPSANVARRRRRSGAALGLALQVSWGAPRAPWPWLSGWRSVAGSQGKSGGRRCSGGPSRCQFRDLLRAGDYPGCDRPDRARSGGRPPRRSCEGCPHEGRPPVS